MSVPPPVSLGDFVRVLHALRPDEAAAAAMARALGLAAPEPVRGSEAMRPVPPVPPQPAEPPRAPLAGGGETSTSSGTDNLAPDVALRLSPSRVVSGSDALKMELDQTIPLKETLSELDAPPLPLETLLYPGWTRTILSGALATLGSGGPIDLSAVTASVIRGEILRRLPTTTMPTLRRGAQVLLDVSDAMTPFARDQRELLGDLTRVVGEDRVALNTFSGCPSRGVRKEGALVESPYEPPAAGTPVLLLSDLGIGRPPSWSGRASAPEWLEFAGILKAAGCPGVALVPYAPPRWPKGLRSAFTVIEWDRSATASRVRQIVGKGHRV